MPNWARKLYESAMPTAWSSGVLSAILLVCLASLALTPPFPSPGGTSGVLVAVAAALRAWELLSLVYIGGAALIVYLGVTLPMGLWFHSQRGGIAGVAPQIALASVLSLLCAAAVWLALAFAAASLFPFGTGRPTGALYAPDVTDPINWHRWFKAAAICYPAVILVLGALVCGRIAFLGTRNIGRSSPP